jgi:hypothetical protein
MICMNQTMGSSPQGGEVHHASLAGRTDHDHHQAMILLECLAHSANENHRAELLYVVMLFLWFIRSFSPFLLV